MPRKTKNPARVDAAVHQHLRRMDRHLRIGRIVFVVSAAIFLGLMVYRPGGPRWLAGSVALGAIFCFLVALFSGLGVLSLHGRRKATRAKLLRICQCGYDLRASDSACPECGTPISDALRSAREAGLDRQYVAGRTKS